MTFMVLSALSFAVMAAFARLCSAHLPVQEVVLARSLVATLLTLPLLAGPARRGVRVLGRRPLLLALRGVTGFVALSCYFASLAHLPFAEAVLLAQTNPVFTVLFAWLFLRESPGARFGPAFALVLAGVLCVVPPDFAAPAANRWAAVGLCGALLAGAAYTEVRALSRTEHPVTIVLWFQLVSVVLAIPGTLATGFVVPRGIDWAFIAGVGLAGQLGQIFLTLGLSRTPAGRATLANPLVVLFGALCGALLFGESLGPWALVGGVLIVAGLLIVGSGRSGSPAASGRAASAP